MKIKFNILIFGTFIILGLIQTPLLKAFDDFNCQSNSLDGWINCAESFRPEVSANENRLAAARKDITAAWLDFIPTANITISKITQYGTIQSGDRTISPSGKNSSQIVVFNIPLFDGGVRYFNAQIAKEASVGAEADTTLTKNQIALEVTQVFTTLVAENYRQRTIKTIIGILNKLKENSFKINVPLFSASIANLEGHLSASNLVSNRTKVEFKYLTGSEFLETEDLLNKSIIDLRQKLKIPENLESAFNVANSSPNLISERTKINIAKNKKYLAAGTGLPEIEYRYTPESEFTGTQFGSPYSSQLGSHGLVISYNGNPAKTAYQIASADDNLSAANDDYTSALLNLKRDIEITYVNLPGSIDRLKKQLKILKDNGIISQLIPRYNDSYPIFSSKKLNIEEQSTLINSLNQFEEVLNTIVGSYSDIMMMQAKLLSSLGVLDDYSKRNNPSFSYDPFTVVDSQN